jgi:hypothetical protein
VGGTPGVAVDVLLHRRPRLHVGRAPFGGVTFLATLKRGRRVFTRR